MYKRQEEDLIDKGNTTFIYYDGVFAGIDGLKIVKKSCPLKPIFKLKGYASGPTYISYEMKQKIIELGFAGLILEPAL